MREPAYEHLSTRPQQAAMAKRCYSTSMICCFTLYECGSGAPHRRIARGLGTVLRIRLPQMSGQAPLPVQRDFARSVTLRANTGDGVPQRAIASLRALSLATRRSGAK